ncbi:MAG TPA: DNA methyltransferase [Blastocatellia bacterium]
MRSFAKPLNYGAIEAIQRAIPADRQGARRHYGVHPYFTRRPFNVVREYILHYSREGDRVLDPFGGSGVTAIEALLENRTGIQNDINPLANFIAQGIADLRLGTMADFSAALSRVEIICQGQLADIARADQVGLDRMESSLELPENVRLPKTSDVASYYELFSQRQLLSLAALKSAIDSIADTHSRLALLLAWSATLAKLNKTFLSAEGRAESRGGSSIFSIYRYKVAKQPIELPPWETFLERAENVRAAKIELTKSIGVKERTGRWRGEFIACSKDVEDLGLEFEGSIDYIFTDPPYGGHISYLDLSTLWNAWLGLLPGEDVRTKEVIVGGEMELPESHYLGRLDASIRACVRMLKNERWLSVVFQHWSVDYFKTILTAAAESGVELRGAVSQVGDPIWSMHKKKNKDSVLAGELILSFFKTGKKVTVDRTGPFDMVHEVAAILAQAGPSPVYSEYLLNRLVIEAWRKGAIDSLNIKKEQLTEVLEKRGWSYDQRNHYWTKDSLSAATLFEE